jgi:hypothetical protein
MGQLNETCHKMSISLIGKWLVLHISILGHQKLLLDHKNN